MLWYGTACHGMLQHAETVAEIIIYREAFGSSNSVQEALVACVFCTPWLVGEHPRVCGLKRP